jgi:membrane protein
MAAAVLAAIGFVLGRRSRERTVEVPIAPPVGAPLSDEGKARPVWRRVADSVRLRIKQDNIPLTSAGVAFYAFLAMVPGLIAAVTIYGLVSDPADVERQVAELADALPESARDVISTQLTSIVGGSSAGLSIGLAASLAAVLWTASGGMAALIKGINSAFGEEETRGFLTLRGISLGLTIGALLFFVVAGFVAAALPLVLGSLGFGGVGRVLVDVGRWPILLVAVVTGIALLYRIAPDREEPRWRVATWGAMVAATVWMVATLGFSFYVSSFGSYSQTYGVLGGVVVLLLWFFLSGFAVLLGAVVDAELEAELRVSG